AFLFTESGGRVVLPVVGRLVLRRHSFTGLLSLVLLTCALPALAMEGSPQSASTKVQDKKTIVSKPPEPAAKKKSAEKTSLVGESTASVGADSQALPLRPLSFPADSKLRIAFWKEVTQLHISQ